MASNVLRLSARRIANAEKLLKDSSRLFFFNQSFPRSASATSSAFNLFAPVANGNVQQSKFLQSLGIQSFSTAVRNPQQSSAKPTKMPKTQNANTDKSVAICRILGSRDIPEEDVSAKLDKLGVIIDRSLFESVLKNVLPDAGRKILVFYKWAKTCGQFKHDLHDFNAVLQWFCKKNDFKAVTMLLEENMAPENSGKKLQVSFHTYKVIVGGLLQAGREKKSVDFFSKMEEYGFEKSEEAYQFLLKELCDNNYAFYAEGFLRQWKNRFYPNENSCSMVVKSWCDDDTLDEATRMMKDMFKAQMKPAYWAYDALIECVCRLAKKKEALLLMPEVKKILAEMEEMGVAPMVSTFNIVISNYCSVRKTQEAFLLFQRMKDYDTEPDYDTYAVLIRSLFLAARTSEGHEMLQKMKDSGFVPDHGTYVKFLKVLCGIQRVDHALQVFDDMKASGVEPNKAVYELLIPKLRDDGDMRKAKQVLKEAMEKGLIPAERQRELLRRTVQKTASQKAAAKKTVVKPKISMTAMIKKKKMMRERKKRLSYVKKPRRGNRNVVRV